MFDLNNGGALGGLGLAELLKLLQGGGQMDQGAMSGMMGIAPAMMMKGHDKKEAGKQGMKEEKTLEELLMGLTGPGAMPGGSMDLKSLLGLLGGSLR